MSREHMANLLFQMLLEEYKWSNFLWSIQQGVLKEIDQ